MLKMFKLKIFQQVLVVKTMKITKNYHHKIILHLLEDLDILRKYKILKLINLHYNTIILLKMEAVYIFLMCKTLKFCKVKLLKIKFYFRKRVKVVEYTLNFVINLY